MTADQLRLIFAHAKEEKILLFLDPLNVTMEIYEINTTIRQSHFLAQVGHESGELRYREEIASGKAYEGRKDLGNIYPGDGVKFKGRGLIQLTGRTNYTAYGNYVGRSFLDNPNDIATDTFLCADVAGWFWHKKKLNTYADTDDIKTITKRINGGLNGFDDRKRLYSIARQVLDE